MKIVSITTTKTLRLQNLMAIALMCGLGFNSANLFAQQGTPAGRVPVSPPLPVGSQVPALPMGPIELAIPRAPSGGGVTIGQSYDGIDFLGSNCGCLPPDTNAAVGNNYVVETVNLQIRVFDKTTGAVLLDEPLSTLFGTPAGSDPFVVYDDTVDRWYVTAIDGPLVGLLLAVSADGNPLDGFPNVHDLTSGIGGFVPDYPKPGFNKDAIFISYNNFGTGGGDANIVAIDKTALLSGTLTYYVSVPKSQFRAMPPAWMHGDTTGGTEWFVSTDGSDTGGTTMRITMMTNYLSNSPSFTYTSVPVHTYHSATAANQPGGTITTFPNTTTYQVHYRNGNLLTSMASALAGDGFVFPKGLFYVFSVSGATPTLLKEVDIDPGSGVAAQMPSVDMNNNGGLGLNWIESSSIEYLSMWVATESNRKKAKLRSTDVTPGAGFMNDSFRIGDYSTTVIDPADGLTFWSANEYVGSDGSTNIWRTHITSFTAASK